MPWHFSAENQGPISISLSLVGSVTAHTKRHCQFLLGFGEKRLSTFTHTQKHTTINQSGHHTVRSPSHIERWGMKCHVNIGKGEKDKSRRAREMLGELVNEELFFGSGSSCSSCRYVDQGQVTQKLNLSRVLNSQKL